MDEGMDEEMDEGNGVCGRKLNGGVRGVRKRVGAQTVEKRTGENGPKM